nr:hypothetical protein [Sphingomonas sp.]
MFAFRHWESTGDIVERHSREPIARVYGRGRTAADAQQDVILEAERRLLRRGRSE